jgi:polar amino acid transport system substrate-binding protein
VLYDAAGKVIEALKSNAWDVAFMAIEPARAAKLEFAEPYAIVEGTYMVTRDSPLTAIAHFDKPGIRIALGRDSVHHLYLQRVIKQATLLPARTGGDAIAMFIAEKLEAVANLKQPLVKYVGENPGYRVIDGRFMEIRLAMGVPKGRVHAIYCLGAFIAELRASGFVADALERSGQEAAVAPL